MKSNIPDIEFKAVVIRMLTELGKEQMDTRRILMKT